MAQWLHGRVWAPLAGALVLGVHVHRLGLTRGWALPLVAGALGLSVAWAVGRRGRTLAGPCLIWCAVLMLSAARAAWLAPTVVEPPDADRPMPRALRPLQELELLDSPERAAGGYRALARWRARCARSAAGWRCSRRWGRVRLEVRGAQRPALRRGDRVRVGAWVHPPPGYHNPGAEGPWHRWRSKGLVGRVRVGHAGLIAVVDRALPVGSAAQARLAAARAESAARIARWAPGRGGALVAALGLGDRSGFDPSLRRWLAAAGVAHLFAVSGAHLGVVVLAVLAVLRVAIARLWPNGLRRWTAAQWTALPAIAAAWAFAAWTGAGRSTLRAAAMATVVVGGRALDARSDVPESLGLGVCLLVLCDVEAAHDAGLGLSVLGVVGVVAGQRGAGPRWWCTLRASTAAWATTGLIAVPLFGQLPWQGPLASVLFAAPLALVWLPLSLLLTALSSLLPASAALDAWFGQVAPVALRWAFLPLDLAVALPAWTVPCSTLSGPRGWLGCLVPFALWWAMAAPAWTLAQGLRRLVVAGAAVAALLALARTGAPRPAPGHVVVHAFDVGHGDATLLRFANGQTMLVDGGGEVGDDGRVGARALLPALQALGVRRIDFMVLSHPHPDHENGLLGVARVLPVGEFWWNGQVPRGAEHEALMSALRRHGTRWRRFGLGAGGPRPASLIVAGARVDVLWPRPSAPPFDARANLNNNSLILLLTVGNSRLLLTGDAEVETERRMLGQGVVPGCVDVLKLGHHGSRTSTTAPWLRTLAPRLVWAGARPWGALPFPHPLVARRVGRAGTPLLLSSDGMIEMTLGPAHVEVRQRRGPGVRGPARERLWRWPSGRGRCRRAAGEQELGQGLQRLEGARLVVAARQRHDRHRAAEASVQLLDEARVMRGEAREGVRGGGERLRCARWRRGRCGPQLGPQDVGQRFTRAQRGRRVRRDPVEHPRGDLHLVAAQRAGQKQPLLGARRVAR